LAATTPANNPQQLAARLVQVECDEAGLDPEESAASGN
jgi:hypothetical protein